MRRQKTLSSWISTTVVTLTLLAVSALSSPGYAQVKPGDFITPENATKVKDLVGPGVYYKVEQWHVDEDRADPACRLAASLQGRDREILVAGALSRDDHRSVVGYVAGQPFPLIDPNDPDGRDQDRLEQRVPSRSPPTTTICASTIATPRIRRKAADQTDRVFPDRSLCRLRPRRPHRSRAAADRSGFQDHRTLLAVRPLSDARAAGNSRHRIHPLALRRSRPRRRHLEPRTPARAVSAASTSRS